MFAQTSQLESARGRVVQTCRQGAEDLSQAVTTTMAHSSMGRCIVAVIGERCRRARREVEAVQNVVKESSVVDDFALVYTVMQVLLLGFKDLFHSVCLSLSFSQFRLCLSALI